MSSILRHLNPTNPLFHPRSLAVQLRFWARAKKIDPRFVHDGKYDVNPPKGFTYSYENITDHLSKSGRKTFIFKPPYVVRRGMLKKEYREFKDQERQAAQAEHGEQDITEQKAKKIVEFLDQYGHEHPEVMGKTMEFNLDEVLSAKTKPVKPEVPPLPETQQYNFPEPVSMAIEEDVKKGLDPIWGKERPVDRKYAKIRPKELYWISRNERHFEDSDRRLSYLKEFVKPYVIHDAEIAGLIQKIKEKTPERYFKEAEPEFQIEKKYAENKEIVEIFGTLKAQIMKTHYKQLPNIALSLAFDLRYKLDPFRIWPEIEREIFQHLHHFNLFEIAKIRYALAGIMPKIGSAQLHKACVDLIKQEIKEASIYDLMYLYTAYKMSHRDKLHSFLYNEILSRKEEISILAKQDPELIANLIYTFSNSRIAKRARKKVRDPDEHVIEADRFVETFIDDLMASFDKMTLETAVRLSTAFTVLRLEGYLDVLLRIQKKVLGNLDKMDRFLTSSLLYSFSKFSKGRSEGELGFYAQIVPLVEKFWPEFSNKEKSRVFYAFTARGFNQSTCSLIDQLFIPWAKENVRSLSYTELASTILSLMFLRFTDRSFWAEMIKNVARQQYVVPMSHYYTFGLCKHYISIFYPKWDLKPLDQATYEAGCLFSPSRVPRPIENEEFMDFYRVLQFKYHINNKPFVEWENLIAVHIAILPQKVGVFKQAVIENFPDSYAIRPLLSLQKFILDNKGWKVWVVNWKEYLEQGAGKDAWFEQRFMEVYTEQSVRFANKKNEELHSPQFDKHYAEFQKWSKRLSAGHLPLPIEVDEQGNVDVKRTPSFENLDSRAFTKFGKQGVQKTPGGAPGAGAGAPKPAATPPPAAAKKPAGK